MQIYERTVSDDVDVTSSMKQSASSKWRRKREHSMLATIPYDIRRSNTVYIMADDIPMVFNRLYPVSFRERNNIEIRSWQLLAWSSSIHRFCFLLGGRGQYFIRNYIPNILVMDSFAAACRNNFLQDPIDTLISVEEEIVPANKWRGRLDKKERGGIPTCSREEALLP